jgi:hypothetical protein
VTDDPEHAERARPWLGEQRRWRAERVRQELARKGDLELIGEVAGWPATHLINRMELNRRLKDSIAGLTAKVKVPPASSGRLSKILIRLTIFLIGLTVAFVITMKLASGARQQVTAAPPPLGHTIAVGRPPGT